MPLRAAVCLAIAALSTLAVASSASAATTSIDYIEPSGDDLKVVLSLGDLSPEAEPDLATVNVTFDGEPVTAEAESLSDASDQIERTAVLAIDVSDSMQGDKFTAAQAAAKTFLAGVPADVSVGLVTFASSVDVVEEPTQELKAVSDSVDSLALTRQTRLYDGLTQAVRTAGTSGVRSVLLLSDGRDNSGTSLPKVIKTVKKSEVNVDVVALAQGVDDERILQQLARAGNGQVLSADDPAALEQLFADEAATLARQVLITLTPPAEMAGKEGTLSVTLQIDGTPVTDDAFVSIPGGSSDPLADLTSPPVPVDKGIQIPKEYMYGGLAAAALGFVVVVFLLFSGRDPQQDAIDRSIEAYTRKGARRLAEASRQQESQSMTQQAVAVAESMLEGQKGLETRLGTRLEAAGMAIKPAEWLLIHVGVTVAAGFFGLLLGGGSPIYMLGAAFLAAVLAWMFLSFKHKRRLKAFKNQLADTLQLLSGSLSAGLSLAQSVDAVVREGTDPMASEFRRALIETRLGVEIEDALSAVALRMDSVDFEWVVMAIRIQRQVGGNLSELLNKVAETIREREFLERQVLSLSAEGRLSVWILGGLPPAFMGYLMLANPTYVGRMFTSPIGWAMLVTMGVLLSVGILWMKKVVKVEV